MQALGRRVVGGGGLHPKGELGEEYSNRQPFWERVFQVKAVSSDKDTLINHPHDGIYELDNPETTLLIGYHLILSQVYGL